MKERILALMVSVVLLLSGCTFPTSDTILPSDKETKEPTPAITKTVAPSSQPVPIVEGDTLTVHYLDVGQADASLIICEEATMLIDGGNAADSDFIYAYLKKLGITSLDYIVCTHAHEDHVGGLSGALNYATVDTVYCPVTEYDSRAFGSFVKYTQAQGKSIEVPSAGDTFMLGSAMVTIIGPVKEYRETNNTSIILRIAFGDTSFLFTGDAKYEAEHDILEKEFELKSTVLKVGHHGSNTSTSYSFLREVCPDYAVISCGKDNSYGHPHEETLSKLRDADVAVYRTDMQGTIIVTSDGHSVSFTTERNQDADTIELPPNSTQTDSSTTTEASYVLNTNTKKFHYPTCSSVDAMKPENRQDYTGSADELVAMGYSPCGRCKPR